MLHVITNDYDILTDICKRMLDTAYGALYNACVVFAMQ